MKGRSPLLALWLGLGATIPAAGQASKAFSLQGSGTAVFASSSSTSIGTGVSQGGWEVQGRFRLASRLSLGLGYQRPTVAKTAQNKFALGEVFLEPRVVLGVIGGRAAIYLAGRVGRGSLACSGPCSGFRSAPGTTLGGGGGVLIEVARDLSLDLGAQAFGRSNLSGMRFAVVRVGLSAGLF